MTAPMTARDPVETILLLSCAHWAARCLQVVAELGVADALGDEPRKADALAAKLGLHGPTLQRMLRSLANHGVFEFKDGHVAHNDASRLLMSDSPRSMRALPRMQGLRFHWAAFGELERSVRTGEPAMNAIAPEGFFGHFASHPEDGRIFDEAMTGKSMGVLGPLVAAYDFTRFGTIGDIGGGAGHLMSAVLDAAPQSRGVVFDLPHVVARAAERPHPRVKYVGGDFFKDTIPVCDLYVMMTILHDWSDEESIQILSAIRRSAAPGTKLLLIEVVIGLEPGAFDFGADLDIDMLVVTTGRERTEPEWASVLGGGGFRLNRVIPLASWCSIVEAEACG